MAMLSAMLPVKLVFAAVWLHFYHTRCHALMYPSIYWSSRNILFPNSSTEHLQVSVLPNSQLSIICPNIATVEEVTSDRNSQDNLYENLYQVNKDSYEQCDLPTDNNSTTRIMECDQPNNLKFHTLNFTSDVKGTIFYFMSTSDGKNESIDNLTSHCITRNMKMAIYVCRNQTDNKCQQNEENSITPTIAAPTSISPTVICDDFWIGFACGTCFLLVYSIIVNIILWNEIRKKDKIKKNKVVPLQPSS